MATIVTSSLWRTRTRTHTLITHRVTSTCPKKVVYFCQNPKALKHSIHLELPPSINYIVHGVRGRVQQTPNHTPLKYWPVCLLCPRKKEDRKKMKNNRTKRNEEVEVLWWGVGVLSGAPLGVCVVRQASLHRVQR